MAKKISRCGARLNQKVEQKVRPATRKKPEVKKTFEFMKKKDADLDNDIESGVTAENIEKFNHEEE